MSSVVHRQLGDASEQTLSTLLAFVINKQGL